MPWAEEFRAEIEHDHRELLACRDARAGRGDWSFERAVERTRVFYRDRVGGFARCRSISAEQEARLLRMVETLATPAFPG